MSIRVINPSNVYSTAGYYFSHAVQMSDLIFVAGQVGLDANGQLVGEGDIHAQTEQAFENIRRILEGSGSGLDLVGKMTVFTTSLDYRPAIHEVRSRVFGAIGHYPASTLAVVTNLARPEWLVEIEVVAAVRK